MKKKAGSLLLAGALLLGACGMLTACDTQGPLMSPGPSGSHNSPSTSVPEFEIVRKDWDGSEPWMSSGKLGAFPKEVMPGTMGEFTFVFVNNSKFGVQFSFVLTEYVDAVDSDTPFMQYRLRMDNALVCDGEWQNAGATSPGFVIFPKSQHRFTLEWRWPFEADTDDGDMLFDVAGGELSVHFSAFAEVSE